MMKTLLTSLLISIGMGASAQATSTQWQDIGGGKARLIAVKDPQTDTIRGAVEIVLNEGWKSYWKSPGGAGIAPEFDFTGSIGVYPSRVRFPVPEWMSLPDTTFFGYKGQFAFPFEADGEASSKINLDLLIGVCEEICIPATASFSISADALNLSDPKSDILLTLLKSRLPEVIEAQAVGAAIHHKDNQVELMLDGRLPTENMTTVLEIPGLWVSDPAPVSQNADGSYATMFTLPAAIEPVPQNASWIVSIIEKEPDNGAVTRLREVHGF